MASSAYNTLLQVVLDMGILLYKLPLMQILFTLIPLVVGALSMYLYAPYWRVRKVPGPPTIPLIGHLHLLMKHGPQVFSLLATKYGPVYRFHMGRQPLIIIGDPELCREVGIKKFKDIHDRSIPSSIAGNMIHQKGLFFTSGTRWTTMRNTIVSMYQPSHITSHLPMMQSVIESVDQHLPTSEDEDIMFSHLALKLATDITGLAAFGVDFGLTKASPLDDSVIQNDQNHDIIVTDFIKQHMYCTTQLQMDLSGSLSVILGILCPILQHPFRRIWERIPGTIDWRTKRAEKNLLSRLEQIVEERANKENRGSKDFLSLVLNARESDDIRLKKVFTSDYVSALAYEQLLAGSTTTAFTLSAVLYLVADHPEVEKKLIEEIDNFGEPSLIPTADDLHHRFPYLDQVIKESLRFFPSSPLIAREALKQVEIGGYVLPEGTWIWLSPEILAKDPKNFPEPEKFRPERFDPNCEEEKQRHPYALIPFGLGPRQCIGMKFSMQEMKVTLIHLYQRYLFKHSPNMERPLALEYGIILNFKYGVKLRVIKRHT
ncbi:hypothetical protein MKW98_016492 [Papaver atlanticum]|uniref:Cytochrome P450 n=1 Tax=Papaver atlanticum TaxID=357466 RepID=A0AAD4XQQ2_9MAGN|nr:hypothetical protein MKW98_016492 [Papaver atlanticum]